VPALFTRLEPYELNNSVSLMYYFLHFLR